MIPKKYLLITAADKAVEPFLISHWVRSFLDTNNTKRIDIAVLDYGLSHKARHILTAKNIRRIPCIKDGHVVNIRLRDTAEFLRVHGKTYDQVMHADCGDIIFQNDISPAFLIYPESIRITSQHMPIDVIYFFSRGSFRREYYYRILKVIFGKPVLNAGVIVGPVELMQSVFNEAYSLIQNISNFLPDQMAINYILHRDGYGALPEEFNYMKLFSFKRITVIHGTIFCNGKPIPVVHNCGWRKPFRAFKNFGYGKECNLPNQPVWAYTEVKAALQRTISLLP